MQSLVSEHPALKLFTELLAAPSPPGREEGVAEIIRQKLAGWGYQPQTDGSGNVWVRLVGQNPDLPLLCLSAHMDEIGMTVTRIDSDGALRVDRSGGLLPHKLGEGPVQVLGDEVVVVGIFSMGSTHTPNAGSKTITWDDVRVITGLTPAQLNAAGVRPGSSAVPIRDGRGPVVFGDPADPLVGAWTFDDRMGCVALLRMLETAKAQGIVPGRPTVVAFTVHEEGGGHGARGLAHRLRPETFISIDGCPIPPGAPLQLDGRPGIWSKDVHTHYDQRLIKDLLRIAREAGSELQPVAFGSGAFSDAGAVYTTGGAARIACFGHVRENSHGYEVARLSVFDNLYKILVQFIKTWEG
ncbi:MAG: M20/M25/M40 family metallo-hydrolase [Anaerolineae bacterium]|nr:M20/M25/M40 family metallo-hydrolase [Anaerolineae bacterium]